MNTHSGHHVPHLSHAGPADLTVCDEKCFVFAGVMFLLQLPVTLCCVHRYLSVMIDGRPWGTEAVLQPLKCLIQANRQKESNPRI